LGKEARKPMVRPRCSKKNSMKEREQVTQERRKMQSKGSL